MIIKFKLAIIAIAIFCVQNVLSQEKTITGTVTDVSGMPIPGANVIEKGTTNGNITDFDGKYTLSNVSAASEIIFSYVGMNPQTITVGDKTTINVVLKESLESLNEVVVVGYGTQKKALVTGASVNIKGEAIAKLNTSTAMEALQGVTPGVSITRNNGAPGAGTKVTIRGLGTVGNSNPLYIIDGVAAGGIDYLNPSDIESIDVLKDAASAAIYGSRAANGVVLVTTKKGKKGAKTRVTYDTYYGFQNIYKNLDPLNAQEYQYIMDEGRVNDGSAPFDWNTIIRNNQWLNANYPGNLGTALGDHIIDMLDNGWEGTNWIDEITAKNASISSHAVNITGGGESNTFSLGVSYFEQESIIGGDISDAGYKRLTARMNTEYVLAKNTEHDIFTVGENFTYTNSENRNVATGNIYYNDLRDALTQNPLMPAYWDQSPDPYGFTPTLDGLDNSQLNPVASLFYRHNFSNLGNKNNSIVGNVYAEFQPIKNLKIRSVYGVDAWFGHGRGYQQPFQLGALDSNTLDGVTQGMYQGINETYTNTISYERTFGDHKIEGLIGTEYLKNKLNMNVGGTKRGSLFESPNYAFLNNVPKTLIGNIDTYGADWAAGGGGLLSYIARAQYNYKEKYLFSATVRRDGSSNFAEGNRWGTFPSFSAGWVLTEEDFLNSSSVVNFAKLRASWGQNGNQSVGNFQYSATIANLGIGYYFGDNKPISSLTAVPAIVPNPDISWETSEQLNIGIDTRFFDSKLGITADWYKKTTRDWLVVAPALGTFGAPPANINGGDIENTGVELMVSWNDEVDDFKYGVTLTGAYNKNTITKLANAEGVLQGASNVLAQGTANIARAEVGLPIGYFYGYKADGILQNQDEVDAYNFNGVPYFADQRPGDVRFRDVNQDGVIDDNDKVMLGNPNPDFELGLQLNAQYKGFYVNTTLSGKLGMQVMQSYRSYTDKIFQNYTTQIFQRWHGEGTSNKFPRLSATGNRNTNLISDIFMQDADYVRINNLTFGYDFTKHLTNVEYLSELKVYATVNNLYTFTKYDGMDPEVGFNGDTGWGSGVDLGLFPQARTVMFGVNLTF